MRSALRRAPPTRTLQRSSTRSRASPTSGPMGAERRDLLDVRGAARPETSERPTGPAPRRVGLDERLGQGVRSARREAPPGGACSPRRSPGRGPGRWRARGCRARPRQRGNGDAQRLGRAVEPEQVAPAQAAPVGPAQHLAPAAARAAAGRGRRARGRRPAAPGRPPARGARTAARGDPGRRHDLRRGPAPLEGRQEALGARSRGGHRVGGRAGRSSHRPGRGGAATHPRRPARAGRGGGAIRDAP